MQKFTNIKSRIISNNAFDKKVALSRTNDLMCHKVYMVFIFDKKTLDANRNRFLIPHVLHTVKKYKINTPAVIFVLTDQYYAPIYYTWYKKIDKLPNFSYNFNHNKKILQKKGMSLLKKTKLSKDLQTESVDINLNFWELFFMDSRPNLPSNVKIHKKVEYYTIYDGIVKI